MLCGQALCEYIVHCHAPLFEACLTQTCFIFMCGPLTPSCAFLHAGPHTWAIHPTCVCGVPACVMEGGGEGRHFTGPHFSCLAPLSPLPQFPSLPSSFWRRGVHTSSLPQAETLLMPFDLGGTRHMPQTMCVSFYSTYVLNFLSFALLAFP